TGVIDQEKMDQLGKVLGVNLIVTGTLVDLNIREMEINARAIKADTGEMIGTGQAKVQKIWTEHPRPLVAPPPSEENRLPEATHSPSESPLRAAVPSIKGLLYINDFKDGGASGTEYQRYGGGKGPLVQDVTIASAFHYLPIVIQHEDGTKGIRFPTVK